LSYCENSEHEPGLVYTAPKTNVTKGIKTVKTNHALIPHQITSNTAPVNVEGRHNFWKRQVVSNGAWYAHLMDG
jgi:hypothetical protein